MLSLDSQSDLELAARSGVQLHVGEHHEIERSEILRICFVGCAAALCWFKVPFFNVLGIGATIIGGYPIFLEAIANLRQRRMTMELSMSIALLAALAVSEIFTVLVITFFVLVAEVIEELTMDRGRTAIKQLLDLLPQKAHVQVGNAVQECDLSTVRPGDVVVVKPGARVPVDGVVVSGHSHIDQSAITGESMPSEKMPGATVYAGTINQSGTIDVQATSIGKDTAFGKIIHAIEIAEHSQAPVQKLADRLAGYLVYFALGCALLTYLVTRNVTSTISVVIVAGACGIAAGTPLAILGGIGRAAREGAIVKGGIFLEQLAAIDTVVFDKTGTLTTGRPQVVRIDCLNGGSENEVLRLAAVAESASEHPLGKAIVEHAVKENIELARPTQFEYVPGKGVSCQFNNEEILVGSRAWFAEKGYAVETLPVRLAETSEVLVGKSKAVCGIIQMADVLRPEAKEAVSALAKLKITPMLLTGDGEQIAQAIAAKVGIADVAAELMPIGKQEFIKKLAASGMHVAMVGDGINDAPALTEAAVGVAIGSGTDVARECADVVLIGSDLRRFVDTVRIARRVRGIIMANFIGTLLVDGIGVLLAACGFLSPIVAAFVHVTSELVFIMNSARLLPGIEASERSQAAN